MNARSLSSYGGVYGYSDGDTYYLTSNKKGQKLKASSNVSFRGLPKQIKTLDVTGLDISKANFMDATFQGCTNLEEIIGLNTWDTSNITNLYFTFADCLNLKSLDLSNWDTSNMNSMSGAFYNCLNLTSLDLSSFDTSKVLGTYRMFGGCSNLKIIYIGSNWTVSKVQDDAEMFDNCISLPNFDSSIVDATKAYVGESGYLTLKDN